MRGPSPVTSHGIFCTAAFERPCRRWYLRPGSLGLYHGLRRAQAHQLCPRRSLCRGCLPGPHPACELPLGPDASALFRGASGLRACCAHGGPCGLSSGARGLQATAQRRAPIGSGERAWRLHILRKCAHAHLRSARFRLSRFSAPGLHCEPVRLPDSGHAPSGHCRERGAHDCPAGLHAAHQGGCSHAGCCH